MTTQPHKTSPRREPDAPKPYGHATAAPAVDSVISGVNELPVASVPSVISVAKGQPRE